MAGGLIKTRPAVAIVIPVYFEEAFSPVGGGDRYPHHLARALRDHCQVSLVTFGPRSFEEEVDGLRHIVVKAGGRDRFNPIPSRVAFLPSGFDLVHVHQLRCVVTAWLAVLCRIQGIPLVVTDLGGGGRSLVYRAQLYRLVPKFILISEFSRNLLPASTWRRAAVVRGGVDTEMIQFYDGPRDDQVLIVNRIMPHKGQNYLIEAVPDNVRLVVAGNVVDGDYLAELRRLARGKNVTFAISPSDAAVRDLYRDSAITVSASVYRDYRERVWPNSELLGLTMLESMASGTPVVATGVGGVGEYVEHGLNGYVVPPNDSLAMRAALIGLLEDEALRRRMGVEGRRMAEGWSWTAVARRVAEIYSRMLS